MSLFVVILGYYLKQNNLFQRIKKQKSSFLKRREFVVVVV